MRYILGLDIGISSVGWSILNNDAERLERSGVRIFAKAEDPKTGESLALPRRTARSMRRRVRRRAHRLERLRRLFSRQGIGGVEEIELFLAQNLNPYTLRSEGLERRLNPQEWIKALYHISARRGFKSNRKSEAKEAEGGKLLAGVKETSALVAQKYTTLGQMFAQDEKFAQNKRNKAGSYAHTVARELLAEEIRILFDSQRALGNDYASGVFEEEFVKIFGDQKPYADKEQISGMVGYCTFENEKNNKENKLRAPKLSYSAELFSLLAKLANLRIVRPGSYSPLALGDMDKIKALAHKKEKVTYKQIRKELALDEQVRFNGVSYSVKGNKDPEDSTFFEMKGYHAIRKAVEKNAGKIIWLNLSQDAAQLDSIAEALTYYKTDQDIRDYLQEKEILPEVIEAVLELSFSKVIHLSLTALQKLLPFLETGVRYDEACEKAGYIHYKPTENNDKKAFLPVLYDEIKNPVVKRAINQTRKVVNAIIRKYGPPYAIHIELARELNKPWDERQKIQKGQEEYRSQKEKAIARFKELAGKEPRGADLLKFRLWNEQDGFCAYSQEYIDPEKLAYDQTYTEVDHIIPYSRSFDDSMANKVLVKTKYNQEKGNRTPHEYFTEEQWPRFEAWVRKNMRGRKQQNLLRKELDAEGMKERNLNDTRYITRFVSNYLRDNLIFHQESPKNPVRTLNGALTAFLRSRWGIVKVREEGDLHHALDAAVIAAASPSFVRRLADYSKRKELFNIKYDANRYVDPETGEILTTPYTPREGYKTEFPLPWTHFRAELLARLSTDPAAELAKLRLSTYREGEEIKPVFVSRMPNRKAGGAAHEETIRSKGRLGEGGTSVKTALAKLNLSNLERMIGKERDSMLYESLKKRLQEFGGKGDKAFAAPFHKPTKNGELGPIVRSIKLFDAGTAGVDVRGGLASNARMVRVDVYFKDKRYYLVPVYVADIEKKIVKDRAIIANKPEAEWVKIDSTFMFVFSLFNNDLVEIVNGKETIFGYYISCHRGTGAVSISCHDRNIHFGKNGILEGIGVKTAKSFKKFHVDVLGDYFEVKSEKAPYELA